MKDKYESPQIIIIDVEDNDIVTGSGEFDFGDIPEGGKIK